MPEDIGVVIVTYNSADEIGACLDALRETGVAVVVVDNASSDGTRDEVRKRGVRLIGNECNAGFAAAVNQGFRATSAHFVLLLNPDTQLVAGLGAMREACALPGGGLSCGKLIGGDGRPQTGFMVRRFPTAASLALEALLLNRMLPWNPVNRRYRCGDMNYDVRQVVDQPAGAFLMIRREVWRELGGFDESFYPLWFEDVDFCRRAAARGYHAWYTPEAVAKHTGGHSVRKIAVEMKAFYWYGSLLRYAARHFGPWSVKAVCAAVIAGSIPRAICAVVLDRSLSPVAIYGRVIRLAGRCLLAGCAPGA